MKTKQEVIQNAYGEYWEQVKNYIDENGWLDGNSTSNELSYAYNRLYDLCQIGHNKIRPSSLKGIENNNQWVKIESESDLPKDYDCIYWIANENGIFDFLASAEQIIAKFNNRTCTHYQPITKPLNPLY